MARPHHYPKNLLVIAGSLAACFHHPETFTARLLILLGAGIVSTCLIASSNYVLNEILDAGSDRFHPLKDRRPLVAGDIPPANACWMWIALAVIGLAIAAWIGPSFFAVAAVFQLMAMVYNVPPIRLKDIPYIDVLCEAINSPLRLLLGWVLVLPSEPPRLELVLAFWAAGGWAMAGKRLNELRVFNDRSDAAAYRKSFAHYDESILLKSMFVYGASTAIFCLLFYARRFFPVLPFTF